jgi:Putative DNA-binding domain
LMEQLLHEGESSNLDYKRDQYLFGGATDNEKSELLKDILAFANGWRHAEAYILIGVEEVAGGRSTVVGVSYHIPENDLQQFVNSKTNRPVTFSYRSYPFEGKQVGVITIPQQDRPLYLIRNFGRLQRHVVYYRQGTTTAIASPDDIARMGKSAEIEKLLAGQSEDARKFQHALSLGALQAEPHPDGGMTLFRLEVRNNDGYRTIDDVCMRTVSLVRVDGSDDSERLQLARPLLAITGTGHMPSNPPETRRNLAASDSLLFDFVRVYCDRRANHSLCSGECVKDHPFQFQGNERWRLAHDAVLRSGKYKVTIEAQGRNVLSVRKQFVFWGDKTGPHCVDAADPSAQSTEPLEFAPTEFDTLPPNMHPHQLRALVTELCKPAYDGMTADEVYRKMEEDPTMCGLSQVRFVTVGALENTTLKPGKWAIVISDEELASFPSGIPGFPNAIRRSDFNIAWQTARGS